MCVLSFTLYYSVYSPTSNTVHVFQDPTYEDIEEIDRNKQKKNRESKSVVTQQPKNTLTKHPMYEDIEEIGESKPITTKHPMYEDIEEIGGNKQKQKKESKPVATQQQETTTTQQEVSPHCTSAVCMAHLRPGHILARSALHNTMFHLLHFIIID